VIGRHALLNGRNAINNTIIGTGAGVNLYNGEGNVLIGSSAGLNLPSFTRDKLIISNTHMPSSLIWGDFANAQLAINWDYNNTPTSNFTVNGTSEFLDDTTLYGTTTVNGQSVLNGQVTFSDILKLKPAIYSPTLGSTCVEQGAVLYGSDDELYFCSSNGWKLIVTQ